jgi:MoxR-like ATPase
MKTEELELICTRIIDEAGKIFVTGNRESLKKILCGFLAGGHYCLRIIPGLGKPCWLSFCQIDRCDWNRSVYA